MKHLMLKLTQVLAICTLLLSQSVQASNNITQAELDQMLAPVALYPDTVLTHVLIAATYPLEVVQASRWLEDNPGISGEDALQAVESKSWDPSVKALVAFPQLLQRLSQDLDWTQQLGEAFLADETAVLASIQQLREKAYSNGNLRDNEQVVVQREREVIVIEPARQEVVYVPVYDTRVVYGDWWWPAHPPVYWHTAGVHFRHNPFHWGISVRVRPWFYFGIFDWQHRHVVVHHHYYHKPPRYYPKRHKHYADARRWQHNTEHRRGVHYRQERLNRHYNSGYGYQQSSRELKADPARRSREVRNDSVTVRENKAQYQRKTAEQVRIRELRQQTDDTLPRQHRPVMSEQRMRTTEQSQQSQRLQPEQSTRRYERQQHDKPVTQRHVSTEQLRERNVQQPAPAQRQAPVVRREAAPASREQVTKIQRQAAEPVRATPQPRPAATAREYRAPQRDVTVQRQGHSARQID
ncbi:DUF3300 domain-containing protein [Rheinheimera muenzenbergensis]|uniref:DUF3300 domain-containing protein n=1 Tax=Rheinheimera muenzenbergensis TaxID=1193628 RepID=A0ABU8C4S9_9GAMM